MSIISRRSAIGLASKVGLGLVAFVPALRALVRGGPAVVAQTTPQPAPPPGVTLPPTPTLPSPAPSPQQLISDRIAVGRVATASPSQIVLEAAGSNGIDRIQLSSSTQFWEGGWGPAPQIKPGDVVYTWGNKSGSNTLVADKVTVNIINLIGAVSDVAAQSTGLQFTITDRRQGAHLAKIGQKTVINHGTGPETTYQSGGVTLHSGDHAQVVGLRLADGSVQVTRLIF